MKDRPGAIITGGTSGIGLAIARKLGADHDLLLVYKSAHDRAKAAQQELCRLHPDAKVQVMAADLAVRASAARIAETARSVFSAPVRVLINAGGHALDRPYVLFDLETIEDLIQTHLLGTMRLSREILPDMYRAKYGRIINFSSMSVKYKERGHGKLPYAVAKAGIESFTEGLAAEVSHRGITVNAIRPGATATPMLLDLKAEKLKAEDLLPPEEVADVAMRLLSQASDNVNGTVIEISRNHPPLTVKDRI